MRMILIYIIAQIFCVITSTIKSVSLIKGTKNTAVILNTIHYIINALVTYLVGRTAALNIYVILITTAVTNILGVWLGLTITDKLRKDRLWRISATVKTEHYNSLITELKINKVKFVTFETDWDKIKLIDVFSSSKEQSKLIKIIFDKYDVKYTVSDTTYSLT